MWSMGNDGWGVNSDLMGVDTLMHMRDKKKNDLT